MEASSIWDLAAENAESWKRANGVPSTAKRERVRVRVLYSVAVGHDAFLAEQSLRTPSHRPSP
jgi:hypothetical protein